MTNKSEANGVSKQLQRLLYVVFPNRDRLLRASRHAKATPAYVWGKKDIRSMKMRPYG